MSTPSGSFPRTSMLDDVHAMEMGLMTSFFKIHKFINTVLHRAYSFSPFVMDLGGIFVSMGRHVYFIPRQWEPV